MSLTSFFTMSTIWLGLIFFKERISRTAAYILRLTRFLETAVLNVFFGATEENFNVPAGVHLMLKNGEYVSRPVFMTRSNSFVKRRFFFESMINGRQKPRRLVCGGLLCGGALRHSCRQWFLPSV
jgi:hypothetical protein